MLDDVPGFGPKENVETTPEVAPTQEALINTEAPTVEPEVATEPEVEATPEVSPTDDSEPVIFIARPDAEDTASYKITGDIAVLGEIKENAEVVTVPRIIGDKLVEDGLAELVD